MTFVEARKYITVEYCSDFAKFDFAVTEALGLLDIIKKRWYDDNLEAGLDTQEYEIRSAIADYADETTYGDR